MTNATPKIVVAVLGNLIMGDDGLGPRVIEELQKAGMPEHVTLLDLGTPGLGLSTYISGYDALVLVDAVHDETEPGTVRTYALEELMAMPSAPRLSPHSPAVQESLALADLEGSAPKLVALVGVVPEDCSMGIRLSSAVEAAVPRVCAEVRRLVGAMTASSRAVPT